MTTTSFIAGVVAVALSAAGCGGSDPFCGDGKLDPGELCDDGNNDDTDFCLSNCTARALSSLTVKWQFNRDSAPGFTGDSCIDLGASRVEVELVGGPEPIVLDESCSFRQVVFIDIPAASYTAKVRVVDVDKNLITKGSVDQAYEFDGGIAQFTIDVPSDSWIKSYVGTFFFRVAWGGEDCSVASPPVAEQRLTLVAGGVTFPGETIAGVSLDGDTASACISLDEQFPQSVLEVPYGDALFSIEGLDGSGEVVYQQDFETFVGAGVNNPELTFSVAPML